ncbi:MAG: YbjQ family protein [Candidatus Cloacimonetes bacterium]|nr:YbjQ family protein [Candidatus Cloacimonadota bacterium]
MVIVNTDFISGKELQTISLVKGSVVQSKHIGRDIMASLKNLIGGELVGYTEMLCEAREVATQRMIEEARDLGADAVVNVRYATSNVSPNASEVIAFGTAVRYK